MVILVGEVLVMLSKKVALLFAT